MDTFHLGLINVQVELNLRPVTYFYCHLCFRWYTVFSERPWPYYCPEHHVGSRKHLRFNRLREEYENLSSALVLQKSVKNWLLTVFNSEPRAKIEKFLASDAKIEHLSQLAIAERYSRSRSKVKRVPPRTTSWRDRLVFELADVFIRDEIERLSVDPSGNSVCRGCSRVLSHRLIDRDGRCTQCSCHDEFKELAARLRHNAAVESSRLV
jgi:hypothetical protein